MGFLTDWIVEWIKSLLIGGIINNLGGLFDSVNNQVGEIATTVGTTPGAWNPGVFSLIQNLSETVVLPIAGLILTFVATYELIQLLIEKNNLHDVDTWIFFKWAFKTAMAAMVLTNAWNIVMAVFDVAQRVIGSAGGLISGSTEITTNMMLTLEDDLWEMGVDYLIILWLLSFIIKVIVFVIDIAIFVIVYGRLIEIYILTSVAPIPLATLTNREFGNMGQNYFKSLCAVGFQGFLILVCVGIYAVLIQNIAISGDPIHSILKCVGYTVLLVFALLKTSSVSKSVFS